MNIKTSISHREAWVTLSGELAIDQAHDLKEALVNALENASTVHIELREVTEVDLSILQLFCAAHRSALNASKAVVLESNGEERFWNGVLDAGFRRKEGCTMNPYKNCLWIQGEEHE